MPVQQIEYGLKIQLEFPYEQAVERTKQALKEQGFGVLTEIDVRRAIREKLNQEFRPYLILGSCNPALAHQALSEEIDIGLLLPCNVVIYQEGTGSVVEAVDPERALKVVGNPNLAPIAKQARERLEKALDSLSGGS